MLGLEGFGLTVILHCNRYSEQGIINTQRTRIDCCA